MTNPALLSPWIRRFLLEHLVNERNLSPNTQKSYRDMLIQFLPFVAGKVRKALDRLAVIDLSASIVRHFLAHVESTRHCRPSTRNQRLAAIHALARFIGEHSPEHLEWCSQILFIPFKKNFEPEITCLDRDAMLALLEAPNQSTAQGRREHALLLFLYNSGARASEATQLFIRDVDWHGRCVHLLGKGGKPRTCPLWASTLSALHGMIGERGPSERVFLNRLRQPMTRSGVYAMVARTAENATAKEASMAGKKVGPHVIRHTAASHLLRAGVDINTIRGWLGHVSIDTTNIYAETDLEMKAKAVAACTIPESSIHGKPWSKQPDLMGFLKAL
jgi:site-specific recombinase XerD